MKLSISLVPIVAIALLSSCKQMSPPVPSIPGYVPRYANQPGDYTGQTRELKQPGGTSLVYVGGLPYYKSWTGNMWWRVRENDIVRCSVPY